MFTHKKVLKYTALTAVTVALMFGITTNIYAVDRSAPKIAPPAPVAPVAPAAPAVPAAPTAPAAPTPKVDTPKQDDDPAPAPPVVIDLGCDPGARMYNSVDVSIVKAGGVYTDPTKMRLHIDCGTPVIAYLHSNNVLKIYLAKTLKMTETSVDVLNQASAGEVIIPTEDGLGTVTLKPFQWGILSATVEHPSGNNGMPMETKVMWGHDENPSDF